MTIGNLLLQQRGQRHIFFLAKFFQKEKHVADFKNGQLYVNRLSYFKGLEEGDTIDRGDKHEGTIVWGQPGQVKIQINGHDLSNDLDGPAWISSNRLGAFNALCMYAGYFENNNHKNATDLTELRSQLLIPDFDGWAGFWLISRLEFSGKTMT